MLSRSAEYALRAVVFIARHPGDTPLRAAEVSRGVGVPGNYLSKVLHALARAGVLTSCRGPAGGFLLASPPGRLKLRRVVEPFDAAPEDRGCLLGREQCGDAVACAAHSRWHVVKDCVGSFFRDTTVGDLLEEPARARATSPARAHPVGPARAASSERRRT